MIILDTNVLSETFKPAPATRVEHWLAAQEPSSIFITTITMAEILYGIEILPRGRRRAQLETAIARVFEQVFRERILPFDEDSARLFPAIVAGRAAVGRPISQFDAMIAAIAGSQRAAVATRNTADFEGCGIRLVNPWHAGK